MRNDGNILAFVSFRKDIETFNGTIHIILERTFPGYGMIEGIFEKVCIGSAVFFRQFFDGMTFPFTEVDFSEMVIFDGCQAVGCSYRFCCCHRPVQRRYIHHIQRQIFESFPQKACLFQTFCIQLNICAALITACFVPIRFTMTDEIKSCSFIFHEAFPPSNQYFPNYRL